MKLKNYMTAASLNFIVLITFLSACNSDQTATSSNSQIKSETTASQNKVEIADFTLPDSVLQVKANQIGKICLPIKTQSSGSNFTVTLTKPTLNGTVTPSVNGSDVCISFVPKSNFVGLDEFDCKICLTNSGFCQEKTWRIAVLGDTNSGDKSKTSETINSKPQTSSKTNTIKTTETTTPISPSRSSIFDPEKKNNDGYVPNNNNNR